MTPTPPERKELEEAREDAALLRTSGDPHSPASLVRAVCWLAAEVRAMRLERALER